MHARILAALVLALAPRAAIIGAQAQPQPCAAQEIEYALAGNLKLSDTPMGQGDGTYRIGPGRVIIRIEGESAQMLAYTMEEHFAIEPSAIFWHARVVTDLLAKASGPCVLAEGTFDGRVIRWRAPVPGYRVDGTIRCEGSLCGKFGAPPPGASQMHEGPYAQWFKPFVLSEDRTTFTMASTPGLKTEQPKQSSEIAIAGREIARRCASAACK